MIWTHHIKNITYNETFVPEGAPATETYQGTSPLSPEVFIVSGPFSSCS